MQRLREASGDLALGFAKVTTIRFEPVRPHMCAGFTIDQLHIGLNLITHPPHASFEDIANAEVAGDLLGVDGFALVSECCVASDHQTVGNLREIGGQIVGDAVDKIFLFRIIRQVRRTAGRRSISAARQPLAIAAGTATCRRALRADCRGYLGRGRGRAF